jgi:hypothetical protein
LPPAFFTTAFFTLVNGVPCLPPRLHIREAQANIVFTLFRGLRYLLR